MIVARDVDDDFLGFAATTPQEVPGVGVLPWWILDLLAVRQDRGRRGIGRALVERVHALASAVDVLSLFGLCDPGIVGFYDRLGFGVTVPGGVLTTNMRVGDAPSDFELVAPNNQCFFLTDGARSLGPRLYLP
jgi:GNAT superfamily N-acetyltransferase